MRSMWAEEPQEFTRQVDLLKDEYTAYPSDTIFCYSNIGMTLLGHALQEISSEPYSELIKQKLLTPLEMSGSCISKTLKDDPHSSKGYSDDGESPSLPLRDLPAGGLNSTVFDLANFTEMIFSGGRFGVQQIVKTETLEEMLRFQDGDAPFDLGHQMGLGWFLDQQNSETSGIKAFHGGDTFLFHSILTTLPRHQLAVIVLTNSESSAGMVNELAEGTLMAVLEAKAGIKGSTERKLSDTEFPASPEDLNTFPGYYASGDIVLQITRDGDHLKLTRNDDTLNLVLRQDGQYHLQYKLLGLFTVDLEGLEELGISHADLNGREVLVIQYHGRKMIFGEKIFSHPVPVSWKFRTGSYEMVNPMSGVFYENVKLNIENDFLVFQYGVRLSHQEEGDEISQLALRVVNDSNSVIYGLGPGAGETIRVVRLDGDEMLSWSGFLFRRVP
jgi:hypothetical protein